MPNVSIEKYIFLMPYEYKVNLFNKSYIFNKYKYFQSLLKYVDIYKFEKTFKDACFTHNLKIIKILLIDERVDIILKKSYINNIFYFLAFQQCLNIVKCFLQDGRIDPSTQNNYLIHNLEMYASRKKNKKCYQQIINILLQDKRVKDKLTT